VAFGDRPARKGGVTTFGEELRRQREHQGLAVAAICDATKVPSRYILALEADAFNQLPGGIFRRSFVRSYVTTLGLDQDLWMKRFEETCRQQGVEDVSDNGWVTFAENVKRGRISIRAHMRNRWFGVLAMMLSLVIATWCCWRLVTHQPISPFPQGFPHLKSIIARPSSK
jgi:cytoskeletal protein RodZ